MTNTDPIVTVIQHGAEAREFKYYTDKDRTLDDVLFMIRQAYNAETTTVLVNGRHESGPPLSTSPDSSA